MQANQQKKNRENQWKTQENQKGQQEILMGKQGKPMENKENIRKMKENRDRLPFYVCSSTLAVALLLPVLLLTCGMMVYSSKK